MKRLLLVLSVLGGQLFAQDSGLSQRPAASGIVGPAGPTFTGGTITTPVLAATGCVSPAYSFTADTDTGMCLFGANALYLQTRDVGGDTSNLASLQLVEGSGSALYYYSATGTVNGINIGSSNQVRFFTNDTVQFTIGTAALTAVLPHRAAAGSAAAPSYSFTGDPDTGLYSTGVAGELFMSLNGSRQAEFKSTEISLFPPLRLYASGGSNYSEFTRLAGTPNFAVSIPPISGTLQLYSGATVASAASIDLLAANVARISGTTTITSVTAQTAGRCVTLMFEGVLTFTDGSNLKLAGNFVTTADDTISLCTTDGVNWHETGRSVN